jgi:phosphoribosylpyrophosphate synthetase
LCTVGTIAKGAALLHEEGAREVYACCTHAVFRYSVHLQYLINFFDACINNFYFSHV